LKISVDLSLSSRASLFFGGCCESCSIASLLLKLR
jgi:hypothetical protein